MCIGMNWDIAFQGELGRSYITPSCFTFTSKNRSSVKDVTNQKGIPKSSELLQAVIKCMVTVHSKGAFVTLISSVMKGKKGSRWECIDEVKKEQRETEEKLATKPAVKQWILAIRTELGYKIQKAQRNLQAYFLVFHIDIGLSTGAAPGFVGPKIGDRKWNGVQRQDW